MVMKISGRRYGTDGWYRTAQGNVRLGTKAARGDMRKATAG
jgi:hypothetical protein